MLRVLRVGLAILAGLAGLIALLALLNAPFWSDCKAPTILLAHRGLAQAYHRAGLANNTCTATRIYPPEHPFLENTIASMRAAFATGADIVEFDIYSTTDGGFAVFHDWTIDCRTNGRGVTREHSLRDLKKLDIGYGYTADGGLTFPFRGQGIGLMPSLDEVLAEFPTRRFLINIKSNDKSEGDLLAARLKRLPPAQRALLMAYGGARPIARLRKHFPKMKLMSRKLLSDCLLLYIAVGWSGAVPQACENSLLLIPSNATFLLWGWPESFLERMQAANTLVSVAGPYTPGDVGLSGIDTPEDAREFPSNFPAGIWTNRIDRVARHFKR